MTPLLTLGDVSNALGVPLPEGLSPLETVAGGSIDSRTIRPGELFFALPGRHVDGSHYISEAISRGAVAAIATHSDHQSATFEVNDVVDAMHSIARIVRVRSQATWIAITGSVGKTTTRRLLASVLSQFDSTHQSPRSFNNRLGVPLTMLGVHAEHRFVVIEIGTSSPGEIASLGELVRPDHAILTAVEECHLEGLATLEGVAVEKFSIADVVQSNGVVVIPSQVASAWPHQIRTRQATNFRIVAEGQHIETASKGTTVFVGSRRHATSLFGQSMKTVVPLVLDIVQCVTDFDEDAFQLGISVVQSQHGRCNPTRIAGRTILDDSYNANPVSMRNALRLLADWPASGNRIAVLGAMRELGGSNRRRHSEIVELASTHADAIVLVDDQSWPKELPANTDLAPDHNAAAIRLVKLTQPGDVVLVKGSRSVAMERVIELFETLVEQSQRRSQT